MTWLTPYIEAWESQYGGHPNVGALARELRPLEDAHGRKDVLDRWGTYLRTAHPLYANAARFSQTYGSWKPKQGLKELRDPLNEESA